MAAHFNKNVARIFSSSSFRYFSIPLFAPCGIRSLILSRVLKLILALCSYSSVACLILITSKTALMNCPIHSVVTPFLVTCHATRTTAMLYTSQFSALAVLILRRFAVTMEYQFEASVDTKQATLNRLYRD